MQLLLNLLFYYMIIYTKIRFVTFFFQPLLYLNNAIIQFLNSFVVQNLRKKMCPQTSVVHTSV